MAKAINTPQNITLAFQCGDITTVKADAIVNAANSRMLGGSGVDGAIHSAAGPELLAACRAVPEVAPNVRCPTGEARITPAFRLPAAHVIHAVGPVFESLPVSGPILRRTYLSVLELAEQHGLTSVWFPAISCGVYGFPMPEAAAIALRVCWQHQGRITRLGFVLFSPEDYELWVAAAGDLSS
ncbi:MAG: macro domain-containing protein [Pseudomonadota bacterium]